MSCLVWCWPEQSAIRLADPNIITTVTPFVRFAGDAYHLTTKGHYLLALRALEALHAAGDPVAQSVRASSWSATLEAQLEAKEVQSASAEQTSEPPLVFQT